MFCWSLEEIQQEYFESAALVIGKVGFTAQKLAVPVRLLLGKYTNANGNKYVYLT